MPAAGPRPSAMVPARPCGASTERYQVEIVRTGGAPALACGHRDVAVGGARFSSTFVEEAESWSAACGSGRREGRGVGYGAGLRTVRWCRSFSRVSAKLGRVRRCRRSSARWAGRGVQAKIEATEVEVSFTLFAGARDKCRVTSASGQPRPGPKLLAVGRGQRTEVIRPVSDWTSPSCISAGPDIATPTTSAPRPPYHQSAPVLGNTTPKP